MLTTHTIELDLLNPKTTPRIHVKQGDALSRQVELQLLEGEKLWNIPEDIAAVVRYSAFNPETGEVARGVYDMLPDGTKAWEAEGNALRFRPAPAMLAMPGIVQADVVLIQAGNQTEAQLATFNIEFYVNPAVADLN